MQAKRMVLLLIPGTISISCGQPKAEYRHSAKAGDFPYVVHLLIDKLGGKIICTGSLIHPQWVLTAAHCTTGYRFIQVHAAMTEQTTASFSKERSAEKSITYPGFVNKLSFAGKNMNNDYSLIRLESSFDVDNINVGVVLLENKTWPGIKGRNCLAVGFGSMKNEDGLHVFSVNVHYGTCPCKTKNFLLNRYICSTVDKKYGSSICPGDSGGPLICNDKQVGVASHIYPSHGCDLFSTRSSKEFGCDVLGTVSVFTNACPVLSWIRECVGDSIPIQPTLC